MRQYLYNNRGVIMWTALFTTIVLIVQIILGINTKLSIEIYGVGKYNLNHPPIFPFQALMSLFHCYNTFFQRNGIKEKVFEDDNILDL